MTKNNKNKNVFLYIAYMCKCIPPPPVSLNQHTLVNRTRNHFIYRPQTFWNRFHTKALLSTTCKISKKSDANFYYYFLGPLDLLRWRVIGWSVGWSVCLSVNTCNSATNVWIFFKSGGNIPWENITRHFFVFVKFWIGIKWGKNLKLIFSKTVQ